VLAHELGHFRRRHVAKRLLAIAAITSSASPCSAGCGLSRGSTPGSAYRCHARRGLDLFLLAAPVFTQSCGRSALAVAAPEFERMPTRRRRPTPAR